MNRRTRTDALMATAYVWADRSTCTRNAVGAVLSVDGRIVATGYNGAPAGMAHCDHTCPCREYGDELVTGAGLITHTEQCPTKPCKRAVHAEANAIAFAARNGVSTIATTLHTTVAPCYPCAQLIINAGIVEVVYYEPYRDPSGIDLLRQGMVQVGQLS